MIIAVTRNDEINMLICQIAFSIFKVPKKIARIRSQDYLNPKFTKVYSRENLPIDGTLDYASISGLSNEAKEKLSTIRPQTLGQASRVSGVSPSDVTVLMVYLDRH